MGRCHISNNYGFIKNQKIAERQSLFSDIAVKMSFLEMGVYDYAVETDTDKELSARIKGVIASVGEGDCVFLQLPTDNGIRFETELIRKIHLVADTKVVLLWHSVKYYIDHKNDLSIWADGDIEPGRLRETYGESEWCARKLLVDAAISVRENADKTLAGTDMIHIAFGLYDGDGRHALWLGSAMQSIAENTHAIVHFHIVHDGNMTELSRQRLSYICRKQGHKITFHNIDHMIADGLSEQMRGYVIGTLSCILLPEICEDIPRIIYLDPEILVNCDIKELWDVDIRNYCMAAVKSGTGARFNCGVFYMNLNKIRAEGNLYQQVWNYARKNSGSDVSVQAALNAIYEDEVLLLDEKWNYPVDLARQKKDTNAKAVIYHYGGTLPAYYKGGEIDRLYMETAAGTPWGTELYTRLVKMSIDRQCCQIRNLEALFIFLAAGEKKLVFYGPEDSSMKFMYDLLSAKTHESYRVLKNPDSAGNIPCRERSFLSSLDKGTFIVFVQAQADEGNALQYLNELGLEAERDYFVIQNILDWEQGGFLV